MDGVCLIFFVIPGIVAYAVDFSNGTIYFPRYRRRRGELELEGEKVARFNPQHYTNHTIEDLVARQTGVMVPLGQDGMTMTRLKSLDQMRARFAGLGSMGEAESMAMAR